MGRAFRPARGNIVYHAINRANGPMTIFDRDSDYEAFEKIIEEAKTKFPIRIYAYVVVPNHWHFILHPFADGDSVGFRLYSQIPRLTQKRYLTPFLSRNSIFYIFHSLNLADLSGSKPHNN